MRAAQLVAATVRWAAALLLALLPAALASGETGKTIADAAPGRGEGFFEVAGEAAYLDHIHVRAVPGRFDPAIAEALVLLADRPLPEDVSPRDEAALARLARRGELRAVELRLTGEGEVALARLYHDAWKEVAVATSLDLVGGARPGPEGSTLGRFRSVEGSRLAGIAWAVDLAFEIRLPP